ncbi:LD-carboxypeptidase [Oleispirillum naphthae]|uniref:LD-carboxypeptidase n=1 Tax=Oleispirillum naphthae TaxID=2838853 RepID=UPI0030823B28
MRIGVVAPGGPVAPGLETRLAAVVAALPPHARPEIRFHPQCFAASGHFAGDDALRAQAFLDVANDARFDAVWFARGGYGSFRLIETVLPRLGAAARGKIYLGYSDVGALLGALYGAGIGCCAHGPMPIDLDRPGGEAAALRALAFLAGDDAALEPAAARHAPAAAFNITILCHLIGTPWLPDLAGHALVLEEVNEPMYRIDRALGQIAGVPAIRRAAGILLGRCGAIVPNDPDFGQGEDEVARFWCARSGIPYLGRADIGHDADNKVVRFGVW